MTPHALTRDALEHADRLALHWLRSMMGSPEPAHDTKRLPEHDVEFRAIRAMFSAAMSQLTPHKRQWLGIAPLASARITENELHCLDALAASQAEEIVSMQRSLRAVFPQARARVAFFDAFEGLGAWLAVRGHWLERDVENAPAVTTSTTIQAPCNRCFACGPEKVSLSSYACLAARSRWRDITMTGHDWMATESTGHH